MDGGSAVCRRMQVGQASPALTDGSIDRGEGLFVSNNGLGWRTCWECINMKWYSNFQLGTELVWWQGTLWHMGCCCVLWVWAVSPSGPCARDRGAGRCGCGDFQEHCMAPRDSRLPSPLQGCWALSGMLTLALGAHTASCVWWVSGEFRTFWTLKLSCVVITTWQLSHLCDWITAEIYLLCSDLFYILWQWENAVKCNVTQNEGWILQWLGYIDVWHRNEWYNKTNPLTIKMLAVCSSCRNLRSRELWIQECPPPETARGFWKQHVWHNKTNPSLPAQSTQGEAGAVLAWGEMGAPAVKIASIVFPFGKWPAQICCQLRCTDMINHHRYCWAGAVTEISCEMGLAEQSKKSRKWEKNNRNEQAMPV